MAHLVSNLRQCTEGVGSPSLFRVLTKLNIEIPELSGGSASDIHIQAQKDAVDIAIEMTRPPENTHTVQVSGQAWWPYKTTIRAHVPGDKTLISHFEGLVYVASCKHTINYPIKSEVPCYDYCQSLMVETDLVMLKKLTELVSHAEEVVATTFVITNYPPSQIATLQTRLRQKAWDSTAVEFV